MTEAALDWHEFASRDDLVKALAETVVSTLQRAIDKRGVGFLAVSGGTTPTNFFQALSRMPLSWDKVIVTLVDERFVDPSSPRSNEGLVRANLLQNEAAAAKFVGLYSPAGNIQSAALRANDTLKRQPLPLDAVILGMGTDGHTASFFPDATNLTALLDPKSKAVVLPVHAESAGEPRLTVTLARLVEAGFIALHIEGPEKQTTFERAKSDGRGMPVRSVLDHAQDNVQVFWAA